MHKELKDYLAKTVTEYSQELEKNPAKNTKDDKVKEDEICYRLVEPFLESVMGYPKGAIKKQVNTGSKKEMDYVLMTEGGSPVVVIEAKAALTPTKSSYQKDLTQLLNYIGEVNRNGNNIQFGILTDGYTYDVYYVDGKAKSYHVLRLDIDDIPDDKKNKQFQEALELLESLTYKDWDLSRAVEISKEVGIISLVRKEFEAIFLGKTPLPVDKQINNKPIDYKPLTNFFWKLIENRTSQKNEPSNFGERVHTAITQQLADYINGKMDGNSKDDLDDSNPSGVETTKDEIHAYHIVKSILAIELGPEFADRVTYKDSSSWFSVQIDGSRNQSIARFFVEKGAWKVNFSATGWDKTTERTLDKKNNLSELYSKELKAELIESAKKFL